MRAVAPAFTKETMMFDLPAQFDAASPHNHVALAMLLLAPALWWHCTHRLALAESIGPERLVWELLPPANAPPGSAGGRR